MRVARSTKRVGFEGARPNNRMKLMGGEGCSQGHCAAPARSVECRRPQLMRVLGDQEYVRQQS
jgi:hypothetical protein